MGRDGESKILFPTMKSLDADKKANKTSEAAPSEACLLYTSDAADE